MKTVERKLRNALTVRDLIVMLEDMPSDAPVLFACDYGDYHHTQQALPIVTAVQLRMGNLSESAYSRSGIALNDDKAECGYFCQKCEQEWSVPTCPECGAICVTEDGELADVSDDPELEVVILR